MSKNLKNAIIGEDELFGRLRQRGLAELHIVGIEFRLVVIVAATGTDTESTHCHDG